MRYKEHSPGWDSWMAELRMDPKECHGKSFEALRRKGASVDELSRAEQEFWLSTEGWLAQILDYSVTPNWLLRK